MSNIFESRYKQLLAKLEEQTLTEQEKIELKELSEQLHPGSPICRDLLEQYSVFDIATFFD